MLLRLSTSILPITISVRPRAATINIIASMMPTMSLVTRCAHSSIDRPSEPYRAAAGEPERPPASGSVGLGVGALLHLLEHLEVEAGGLLPLRILPECLQEFPDKGLRRDHQVDVVDYPIIVGVRRDVGTLEGIGAEIEHLWYTQTSERLGPQLQRAGRALLREHQLPIVIAQCHELLVVIAVEEPLARALLKLAGQIWHQVTL